MGFVPPRPLPPRGQSNQVLLRLMQTIDTEITSRETSSREAVQFSGVVSRRFRILTKHREEAHAQRQAEAALAWLVGRYGDCVHSISRHGVLRLFACEGLIGYGISGTLTCIETLITLPDGICLSYETLSGDQKYEYQWL